MTLLKTLNKVLTINIWWVSIKVLSLYSKSNTPWIIKKMTSKWQMKYGCSYSHTMKDITPTSTFSHLNKVVEILWKKITSNCGKSVISEKKKWSDNKTSPPKRWGFFYSFWLTHVGPTGIKWNLSGVLHRSVLAFPRQNVYPVFLILILTKF